MTVWDVMTWLAIAVLGPGALIIFGAFLRGLARPAAPEHPTDEDARTLTRR